MRTIQDLDKLISSCEFSTTFRGDGLLEIYSLIFKTSGYGYSVKEALINLKENFERACQPCKKIN